jgi:hypothetical protein
MRAQYKLCLREFLAYYALHTVIFLSSLLKMLRSAIRILAIFDRVLIEKG